MAIQLTDEQRLVVSDRGGKLLVSAAAGSGKTRVLVERLMSYILDPADSANIDDFLIITYTKAAAAELRAKIASRLSELIAENPGNKHLQQQLMRLYLAKISTVHSFCTDVLRQYAYRLDIPADFRVADENEVLQLQIKALDSVLDSAYSNAMNNVEFREFIDSQGFGRDDRQIPEIVLKVYNSARCHKDPESWLDGCLGADSADIHDACQTVWGRFLLEDLKQYVSLHIVAFQKLIAAIAGMDGMEKPAALLQDTVRQLTLLRDSEAWDDVIRHMQIQFGTLTFTKNCRGLEIAEKIKAVRTACKEGLEKRLRPFGESSSEILHDLSRSAVAAKGLVALTRDFSKEYNRLKKLRSILDFSDLEHYMLDLLIGKQRTGSTAVARELGNCFREIMVDEYQDSNEIQDAIFSALTERRQNCFMVGDVKQSIYQFRLADPSIFIEKYNTYSDAQNAVAGEGRRILLSQNFRSSAGVISGVNDVFVRCMSPEVGGLYYGENEMLIEGISHCSLNEPEVSLCVVPVESDAYAEEAAYVADQILTLLNGSHMVREGESLRPIRPEDIAILLRSPGSVGSEFQYALQTRGIQCSTGDSAELLEAEEISAVISILQVIVNPLLDIPLAAALTSPVFGFDAEDLALLRGRNRRDTLFALLQKSESNKAVAFLKTLEYLRKMARLMPVTRLLSAIYVETGLLATYSAFEDGERRVDNLQTFYQLVSDFESAGPKELSQLLEFLNTARERGLRIGANQQDKGTVTIMSIHKSKGLEFPVVFLCGLSRRFNQDSAHAQVLCDKDLGLGLSCVDATLRVRYPNIAKRAIALKTIKESVSEELRVLYVAMTRARDRLIMTCSLKNPEKRLSELAMRLEMTPSALLCMEAGCPGDWVLQTALYKTEAGQLFALGGNPGCAEVSKHLWNIGIASGYINGASAAKEDVPEQFSGEMLKILQDSLMFQYTHCTATKIPSKLTVTQLKGRELDREIAEGTQKAEIAEFRKPALCGPRGKAYGNTVHLIMQYIDLSRCGSSDEIAQELHRMVEENLIGKEQADTVDPGMLYRFFDTTIGRKLQTGNEVIREFKFSVLDRADKYYPEAEGEEILLQGVVDCALIEEDGITVLDFKSDRVTEETLQTVAKQYILQVQSYASALTRIYRKPIKAAHLYFFGLNRFVDVI